MRADKSLRRERSFSRLIGLGLAGLCLVCLAAAPVYAQAEIEFAVVPLSAPDGMLLIIGGPPLHPSAAGADGGWIGYHIYRRSDGDDGFVRITSAPLSRSGSLAELERAMGGALDGFERFAGLPDKSALWRAVESYDSSIVGLSFISKNFRRALGLMMTDTKVESGRTYAYRAVLVAADGAESEPSEPQSAVFGEPLIPLVGPLDISGESTEQGVVISWQPNPGDSGAFSYSVYRCPDSIGSFLRLNVAALTPSVDSTGEPGPGSFVDSSALAGRTYYYAVVSTDYAGNESPRQPLVAIHAADNTRLPVPQNLAAVPSDLGITVTWDTVSGTNIAGYHIYRSTDADSNYLRLNPVILPTDTGLYEDRETSLVDRYFYRVTAVDRTGRESEQSARTLSLFENRRQPMPPQDVRAVPRSNGIELTWQTGDEPDLRGYYVYRADSYNGALTQISPLLGKDTTKFIDSSGYLAAPGSYWYLVQAVNFSGLLSRFSIPVVASPDKGLAADAPRSFFGYQDGRRARLFWSRPEDPGVAGFVVYRAREEGNLAWERITAEPLPRSAGDFTDTTAIPNSVWLYHVRAINDRGEESAPSHQVRLVAADAALLPPGGLRVAVDGGGLRLDWSPSLEPSTVGYRVYRRTDQETWARVSPGEIAVPATTWHDGTVRPNTRYYYAVACVDGAGRESDRSTEVSFMNR